MSLVTHYEPKRQNLNQTNRIITIIGIGLMVSLLGDVTLYIVLPTQYGQAGILAEHVGLMLAANRAIRIFLNSPYGFLIERLPRRTMLIPSLIIGGFASVLYVIPGFWTLLIGRLIWGMAWAGIYLGCTTVVLDISDDTNRGRYIGRLQMWMFVGMGVSSIFGGVIFDLIGYAPTFALSAVLIFMGAGVWAFLLPETRPADVPVSQHIAKPRGKLRLNIPLVLAILIYGLVWLIFMGFFAAALPLLLQNRLGDEIAILSLFVIPLVSFTGLLSALNTVISLLSSPFSGWLSDQSGNRWRLIAYMMVVGVLALSLCAVGDAASVIGATMLIAVVSGVMITQLTSLVGDYAPPLQRGRILGVMNTVGDAGAAAGPFIGFLLIKPLGLVGVFTLSTLLIAAWLPFAAWMMIQPVGTPTEPRAEVVN